MDILVGIVIKAIDIIVGITSLFMEEAAELLSKLFKRKDKKEE